MDNTLSTELLGIDAESLLGSDDVKTEVKEEPLDFYDQPLLEEEIGSAVKTEQEPEIIVKTELEDDWSHQNLSRPSTSGSLKRKSTVEPEIDVKKEVQDYWSEQYVVASPSENSAFNNAHEHKKEMGDFCSDQNAAGSSELGGINTGAVKQEIAFKTENEDHLSPQGLSNVAIKKKPLFSCHVCNAFFPDAPKLLAHMYIHSQRRSHECPYCKRVFANATHRTQHIRTHTGEKPFRCNKCPQCFMLESQLRRHELSHSGEKPHRCEVCDKTFAHKQTLNSHMKTHKEEETFQCKMCYKKYSTLSYLSAHCREMHRINVNY